MPRPFAVLIPVTPGPSRLGAIADTLASVRHHEPAAEIVVIDDDAPGRNLGALLGEVARGIDIRPGFRRGRGRAKLGGLLANLWHEYLRLAREDRVRWLVKMDDDALCIGPFAAAIDEGFARWPTAGQLGKVTPAPTFRARIVRMARRLRWLRHPGPGQGPLAHTLWGPGRHRRKVIGAARANGYRWAVHCQGGSYALARDVLLRWRDRDRLRPEAWLETTGPEDMMTSLLVRSVGLDLGNLDGPGEPFGIEYRGLRALPADLLARGHAFIHSVKNDDRLPEAAVRDFFRRQREGHAAGLPSAPAPSSGPAPGGP